MPAEKSRVAFYARYSTDKQDVSVARQFADCQRFMDRERSWQLGKTYHDEAISSATMRDRHGMAELLVDAKKRRFDILVVECIDRISRDRGDLDFVWKRLCYYGVKLYSATEGPVTDLMIGIRSLVGPMFMKDLSNRVRSGFANYITNGKIPGGTCYGYRLVPGKQGEREIIPEQRDVVLRIFREYVQGASPLAIALGLTKDGIPSPGGGAWNQQGIVGGGSRSRGGIISNRMYIGEYVWGRTYSIRDPERQNSPQRKFSPEEDKKVLQVPQLAFVPNDLFEAAQELRTKRGMHKFGPTGKLGTREAMPRNNYLLGGLLKCAECKGNMIIVVKSKGRYAGQRVGCAHAFSKATCSHRRSYDLDKITTTVLDGVRDRLTDREALAEFTRSYHQEYAAQEKTHRVDRVALQRRLNQIEQQLANLADAISMLTNRSGVPALASKMDALEGERIQLTEKLKLSDRQTNVITLVPAAIEKFCRDMTKLHTLLTIGTPIAAEHRFAFHNVFDRIDVVPTAKRMPYMVNPFARVDAFTGLDLFPERRSSSEILESEGVTFFDKYKPGTSGLHISKNAGKIVSLGQWAA